MELKDQWVEFKYCDIYLPDPQQLLFDLYGNNKIRGKVADLSDDGKNKETFAVILVDGLAQPVIVPIDRLVWVS